MPQPSFVVRRRERFRQLSCGKWLQWKTLARFPDLTMANCLANAPEVRWAERAVFFNGRRQP